MIKLKNVNKYFNKNRNNEIHVINNTSIEFPKTGLVAITGPSGCGKTTLLNVIAGLDSFHSGEITYEDKTVHKYKASVVDPIRNEKIGFIFQNYHLLPDKTVYDNIKTSLNIAGLYDKERIEERINYSLEQVGMYNYRKRNVLALSGGQQQRIGIARAIAKNPEVILADEPTGNLDSNNTFEIMSLIKNISKTKLVILVTHERNLVDFYADRIIELKDGSVINDYQNFNDRSYEHKDERLIYLKDLQKEDLGTRHIDYYYEKENKKQFNLKVVEINNTLYIKADSNKKISFIDDESEVRLLDEHKHEVKADDLEPLDFDNFKPIEHHHKHSLFRWRDTLFAGLKKLFVRKKLTKKLFIFVYFVISGLIAVQLASLGNLIKIDEREFISAPKDFIGVSVDENLSVSEIEDIIAIDGVEMPYYTTNEVYIRLYNQTFYQTSVEFTQYSWVVKSSWVSEDDLLAGTMPAANDEVLISTGVLERALQWSTSSMGINEPIDFIGFEVFPLNQNHTLKVVGVIDTAETIIVTNDQAYALFLEQMYSLAYSSVNLYEDDITIDAGRMPVADNEIIALTDSSYGVGDTIGIYSVRSQKIDDYQVVGTFTRDAESTLPAKSYLMSESGLDKAMIYNNNPSESFMRNIEYQFYAENKTSAVTSLENDGYEAYDIYQLDREEYVQDRALEVSGRVISLLVILAGVVLYIFFVMRTSLINRVKEVGIYRAIGASKADVYKVFLSEILVYTTIASVSGYLLSSYILIGIENQVQRFFSFFYLPAWLLLLGLAGIYLVNIVFGLLPVYTLLRKTPAEILAKYDI